MSANEPEEEVVSAQVLLRSASGRVLEPDTQITAENIAEFAPSSEVTERAQRAFEDLGFEVGLMVGISFSIAAPASHFEETFETSFAVEEEKRRATGARGLNLPLSALPDALQALVIAVALTGPVDFGPVGFGPCSY